MAPFLGRFAIYGQEGYLSTSKDGPEIDDYTANIGTRSYYYFISEPEGKPFHLASNIFFFQLKLVLLMLMQWMTEHHFQLMLRIFSESATFEYQPKSF